MNKQKLKIAIDEFSKNRKNNSAYYEENWAERNTISHLQKINLLL